MFGLVKRRPQQRHLNGVFYSASIAVVLLSALTPGANAFDGRDYKIRAPKMSMPQIEAAIKNNPNNPIAYCERGQANLCAGECEAAIADFTTAIKLDKRTGQAYVGRSRAYEMMDKTGPALADAKIAVAVADRSCLADAIRENITILRNQRKLAEAVPLFEKLIASTDLGVGPHDRAELRQERADIYVSLNKPELAIADINADADTKSTHLDRYLVLARAYELLHKPEGVLEAYSRGIARGEALRSKKSFPDRHLATIYEARAKLYDKMGKHDLARADRQNIGKTDYHSVYEDLYPAHKYK